MAGLFAMGGSVRADVQSMDILDPIMIICCGAAMLTLKQEHWQEKWLLIAFGAVFSCWRSISLHFRCSLNNLPEMSPI